MIIVTGAAGFVGSNNVKALNDQGLTDVIAVDNLTKADKFRNLTDCEIADYLDKRDFLELVRSGRLPRPEVVFHQGACSDTMETDGRYMLDNNYRYSMALLRWCQDQGVPLVYASSAAVYGLGPKFVEGRENERPLNIYGYSKFLFDQIVRRELPRFKAPVIGLRYFNVYGPREAHKGRMASVAFHHFNQFRADGKVRLFEGSHGYADGAQRRDFIHVDDVIQANLHFWNRPVSGIYNLGTGRAQAFNDVALAVVNTLREHVGHSPMPLEHAVRAGTDRVHRISRSAQGQVPGLYAGGPHAAARRRVRPVVQERRARHRELRPLAAAAPAMSSSGAALRRAAFLDRDGVINIDRGYVFRREDFEFVPGVLDAARRLRDMGFLLVVASNQSGIGRGLYSEAEFNALTAWMRNEFLTAGAPLAGVYFCPHHPTEALGEYRRVLRVPQAGPRHVACRCARPRHRSDVFGDVRRQGLRPRGGSRCGRADTRTARHRCARAARHASGCRSGQCGVSRPA